MTPPVSGCASVSGEMRFWPWHWKCAIHRGVHLVGMINHLESRCLFAFGDPVQEFGNAGYFVPGDAATEPIHWIVPAYDGGHLVGNNVRITYLTTAGTPKRSFGTEGSIQLPYGTIGFDTDLSGRIYSINGGVESAIRRFTAKGKLDTSFGRGGKLVLDVGFEPRDIAIDASGKIFVAGNGPTGQRTVVQVYDSEGAQAISAVTLRPRKAATIVDLLPQVDGSVLAVTTETTNSSGGYDVGCGCFYEGEGILRSGLVHKIEPGTFTVTTSDRADALLRAYVPGSAGSSYLLTEEGAVLKSGDGAPDPRPPSGVGLDRPLGGVELPDGRMVYAAADKQTHQVSLTYMTADGQLGPAVATNLIAGNSAFGNRVLLGADGALLVAAKSVGKFDVSLGEGSEPFKFAGGRANDLADDGRGRLHLTYFDAASRTLKYASRNGGFWSDVQVIDTEPGAGEFVSMAFDQSARPVLAYFAAQNADLKLAWHDGSAWQKITIDRRGSVGQYPSVFVGADDKPSIAYYAKSTGDLRVASVNRGTGAIAIETVDSAGDVGRSTSIAEINDTGRVAVAYADTTSGAVRLAERQTRGRGWAIQSYAQTTQGADFISLTYEPGAFESPTISYYDTATADLRIARRTTLNGPARIENLTVATRGAVGLYSAVANAGYILMAYDRSRDQLLQYRYDSDAAEYSAETLESGGRFLSVARYSDSSSIFAYAFLEAETGRLVVRNHFDRG